MKSLVGAATFALFWVAACSMPATAQVPPAASATTGQPTSAAAWGPGNPQIEIAYVTPKNSAYRPLYDKLKSRQVLEALQAFLAPLRLPRKLAVRIDECGNSRSHYKPGEGVTICYEYISGLEQVAPNVKLRIGGQEFTKEDALVGAFVHVALNEVARATFDILEIPVWGREEHAADRVAGFLMLQFGDKIAYRTLVGTSWFLSQSSVSSTGLPTGDFAYTRSVDGDGLQRFYNVLCVALGGDGVKFAFLKKSLPEGRANGCRWEYLQLARSFNDTFMPYVDRDSMQRVRNTDWLSPNGAR